MYALQFAPPYTGLAGEFNTFRLGRRWSMVLNEGDRVLLLDAKESRVIGEATVLRVARGKFGEMAREHAASAHNWKGTATPVESLIASMQKRYGPTKCTENSTVSVIYLEVANEDVQLSAPSLPHRAGS